MNKNIFVGAGRFYYNGKHFEIFYNLDKKMAILELDKGMRYMYPQLADFLCIVDAFSNCNKSRLLPIKSDKKVAKFIPKVILGGLIITLTANFAGITAKASGKNISDYVAVSEERDMYDENQEYIQDIGANYDLNSENNRVYVNDDIAFLQTPANGDEDLYWLIDGQNTSKNTYVVTDASAYEEAFGFSKPNKSELIKCVNNNSNLSSKQKSFINSYIYDAFNIDKNIDFSILKANLDDLKISEVSDERILKETGSSQTTAYYSADENIIYVKKGINYLNRNTNDFIVLTHELTHAARTKKTPYKGKNIYAMFNVKNGYGDAIEEGMINYFSYLRQANGDKEKMKTCPYYILFTNYAKVIKESLGDNYKISDFFNHSSNYLALKLDEAMGDKNYAMYILMLIDQMYLNQYSPGITIDKDDYGIKTVNDYISDLYYTKELNSNMTYDAAKKKFDKLWSYISNGLSLSNGSYDYITYDNFKNEFDESCNQLEISKNFNRSR